MFRDKKLHICAISHSCQQLEHSLWVRARCCVGGGGPTRVACGPHSVRPLNTAPDVTSPPAHLRPRTPTTIHLHHRPLCTRQRCTNRIHLKQIALISQFITVQPLIYSLDKFVWNLEDGLTTSIHTSVQRSDIASHISIRAYQRRFEQLRHEQFRLTSLSFCHAQPLLPINWRNNCSGANSRAAPNKAGGAYPHHLWRPHSPSYLISGGSGVGEPALLPHAPYALRLRLLLF